MEGQARSGAGRVMAGGGGPVGAWGMVGREARARSAGMGLDGNKAGRVGQGRTGWDRTEYGGRGGRDRAW